MVTDNDLLNGVAVTANTDVTPITTGPLSIDSEGVLTLAPNGIRNVQHCIPNYARGRSGIQYDSLPTYGCGLESN
jgi:hypothetical protein